ncbi:DUF4274 domain-containing protein [Porphyrobacter sp. LM 6]|jgi:hypothetical protein|uniref:DUF4274 domain-containing protein n=1 Tax=Porphyrobacter sp. LM 6 TaxID=1896196 RepID=UPI0008638238|nr:DUF4274 domain-containing protein [Porphyrobacter sp. LM 6]AOL95282.1 hypothetical protein BG023_112370 [Porphyrobacter sp. LM 6]
MGIFSKLFGKKPHDPAQALIDWLDTHPHVCRRTVASNFGAQDPFGARVLTWIVTRPDCDRGTAAEAFWKSMAFGAVKEMSSHREDPAAATPSLDLISLISEHWRQGRYGPAQFGCETEDYWQEFCKDLRRFRCKARDFDLPDGIRDPISGERFYQQRPVDHHEGDILDDLVGDVWVCDRAIQVPEYGLPARKARLGY